MALRSDDRRKSIQTIFGTKIKMLEISSRHSVWKSQNKSHYKKSYILSVKSLIKMPKKVHFGEFFLIWIFILGHF